MSYNGWKNRDTWNVALWIQNDEGLYNAAYDFINRYGRKSGSYKSFIEEYGLETEKTPDGSRYLSETLNYSELDEMMMELAS